MQFVKNHDGGGCLQLFQVDAFGDRCRPSEDDAPIVRIIPIEVVRTFHTASCGLADLPRTGDQSHLTVPTKMILQHAVVQAFSRTWEAGLHQDYITVNRRIV